MALTECEKCGETVMAPDPDGQAECPYCGKLAEPPAPTLGVTVTDEIVTEDRPGG